MKDQELVFLLQDAIKVMNNIIDIIKDEKEIDDENETREKLSEPKSQDDYMKNLEILHSKLFGIIEKIREIGTKKCKRYTK